MGSTISQRGSDGEFHTIQEMDGWAENDPRRAVLPTDEALGAMSQGTELRLQQLEAAISATKAGSRYQLGGL